MKGEKDVVSDLRGKGLAMAGGRASRCPGKEGIRNAKLDQRKGASFTVSRKDEPLTEEKEAKTQRERKKEKKSSVAASTSNFG